MKNKYELTDGIEMNLENPDRFQIPDSEQIEELKVEDAVKLGFAEIKTNYAERMWVQITDIQGDKFIGNLDSYPAMISCLKYKDVIEFEARHILDIHTMEDIKRERQERERQERMKQTKIKKAVLFTPAGFLDFDIEMYKEDLCEECSKNKDISHLLSSLINLRTDSITILNNLWTQYLNLSNEDRKLVKIESEDGYVVVYGPEPWIDKLIDFGVLDEFKSKEDKEIQAKLSEHMQTEIDKSLKEGKEKVEKLKDILNKPLT